MPISAINGTISSAELTSFQTRSLRQALQPGSASGFVGGLVAAVPRSEGRLVPPVQFPRLARPPQLQPTR